MRCPSSRALRTKCCSPRSDGFDLAAGHCYISGIMDEYEMFLAALTTSRTHLARAIRQIAAGTLWTRDWPADTTVQTLDQARQDIIELDRILERHSVSNVLKI